MRELALVLDLVAFAAFLATIATLVTIPSQPGSAYSAGAKVFSVAACAVYAEVTFSDVFGRFGAFQALHAVEAEFELLWAPFVLFAIYSLYARQQLNDAHASRVEALQAGEMTRRIVQTMPAGIVMIDDVGGLTFSNQTARELLDLEQDDDHEGHLPTWTLRVSVHGHSSSEPIPGFRALLRSEPLSGATVIAEWPTGWRRRLSVNTAPVLDPDGRLTSVVAAFVENEPWRSHPR